MVTINRNRRRYRVASQESETKLHDWFLKSAQEALKTREPGCWYHVLTDWDSCYPNDTWALAIGWLPDEESPDGYSAYAGVVFQPANSIMQCDLDVDWQMPVLANGEVDDTETCIEGLSTAGLEMTFDWLLDIAKSYGLTA